MMLNKKHPIEAEEVELEQALRNFRESARAWSNAEYGRPRTLTLAHQLSWRLATIWALGCAVVVGSLSGGLYERHHRQELARGAAQREMQKLQAANAAEQPALDQASLTDEDLLAAISNDVERQVPSAMEPLAQLMDGNTNH